MASGEPLNDADREPWLSTLHDLISKCLGEKHLGVLACSALKRQYRQRLLEDHPGVQVVYLVGDYDLIRSRMTTRRGHYMKPDMLKSQFEALEEPVEGLTVDAAQPVDEIVRHITHVFTEKGTHQ
jgi:gluconokinase